MLMLRRYSRGTSIIISISFQRQAKVVCLTIKYTANRSLFAKCKTKNVGRLYLQEVYKGSKIKMYFCKMNRHFCTISDTNVENVQNTPTKKSGQHI